MGTHTAQTGAVENVKRHGNCGVITCKLIDLLELKAIGDTVTSEEMTKAIGKEVKPQAAGYGYLNSAITFLLNERGSVWRWQRGAGCIKRLDAKERLGVARTVTNHVRRVSKKSLKNLGSIDIKDIPEQVSEYGAVLAMTGSIALFADTNTRKKLEARKVSVPLDADRLLEAFK